MKTLFTLSMLCASYFLLSQNIENKLGQNGNFIIKEAGDEDKTLFRFKKDFLGNSELVIARDPYVWPPSEDIWMLDVHSLTNNFPNISFASFGTIDQGAVLHFQKANGSSPPGAVQADNILGSIYFTGYKDATVHFQPSAIIESKVISVGGNGPAADITFSTSNGTSLSTRMTINDDGKVIIADLAGTGTVNVAVDATGKLIRAASAPSGPADNSLRLQLEQLEQENAVLRSELVELRKMIEGILEEE